MTDPTHAESSTPSRSSSATGALALAAVFMLLLFMLHVVRQDLDPSWHMISEYLIGSSRWMMALAFFALAASFLSLVWVLRPVVPGRLGMMGLVFLVLASVGATFGGLFPPDPVGTPSAEASTSGLLHGVSFMLGVPATLLAVTIINARLWQDARWRSARLMLLSTGCLVWATMIVFAIAMGTHISSGATGPEFLVGWQNRAAVLAWAFWVVAVSWRVRSNSVRSAAA